MFKIIKQTEGGKLQDAEFNSIHMQKLKLHFLSDGRKKNSKENKRLQDIIANLYFYFQENVYILITNELKAYNMFIASIMDSWTDKNYSMFSKLFFNISKQKYNDLRKCLVHLDVT